jgi:hypothetical protein
MINFLNLRYIVADPLGKLPERVARGARYR